VSIPMLSQLLPLMRSISLLIQCARIHALIQHKDRADGLLDRVVGRSWSALYSFPSRARRRCASTVGVLEANVVREKKLLEIRPLQNLLAIFNTFTDAEVEILKGFHNFRCPGLGSRQNLAYKLVM
jgi:hypothetical protein